MKNFLQNWVRQINFNPEVDPVWQDDTVQATAQSNTGNYQNPGLPEMGPRLEQIKANVEYLRKNLPDSNLDSHETV